jgi:transcriptional regulator with XRE-family HTH domain
MDILLIPISPVSQGKGEEIPLERTARIRLVEERKNRGWSQRELADYLGTTQHNVSRWEAGLTTPGPYFRTRLCTLFGLSAHELLFLEGNARASEAQTGDVVAQLFLDFKHQARQTALTGEWCGTARDEAQGLEYRVTLRFRPAGRLLRGEGQLHDVSQNADLDAQSVTVAGRLVYERFLLLEYTLGEPQGALQFGFVLLEFALDGQILQGGFVGYGALVTRGIVIGTVRLQKQHVLKPQPRVSEK